VIGLFLRLLMRSLHLPSVSLLLVERLRKQADCSGSLRKALRAQSKCALCKQSQPIAIFQWSE
jgi:hypothetical protein